jgi:hypothetical protein
MYYVHVTTVLNILVEVVGDLGYTNLTMSKTQQDNAPFYMRKNLSVIHDLVVFLV